MASKGYSDAPVKEVRFRADSLDKPLTPDQIPDSATNCLAIGVRLVKDEFDGSEQIELVPVDDDLARDLNALTLAAFRSGEQLAKGGDDIRQEAGGSLKSQLSTLGELTHRVLEVARTKLRDPKDPQYELTGVSPDTFLNPETPYFVLIQEIVRGTGHEDDPFNAPTDKN